MRRPDPQLAEGEVTYLERQPVDLELADAQWRAYVAALEAAGWSTVEVPSPPGHPDSVFIEDTAVVHGRSALICLPGATSRRGEVHGVRILLGELGYRIGDVVAPGTLDGGDVMQVGSTIYIGEGGRTNADGIEQARSFFAPDGATVRRVPNSKVLHLKSAVTALPDGQIIGFEPAVDDPAAFDRFIAMPEESGAHVVDLGENRLLVARDCPGSHEVLRNLGYELVAVDISEFEKLEGCVTCLSIRLRDQPTPPMA